MYLDLYKLPKDPFRMTPEAETGFWSDSQHRVWVTLAEGVEHRQGLIVVTGEIGLGKTTILRAYLKRIVPQNARVIYIPHATLYLSFKGLVKTMLKSWGEGEHSDNLYELLDRLEHGLRDDNRQGRTVILVIDEAQNLPLVTLKHLTTLSNFETQTDKLLQMVLVGQPELKELLKRAELHQLAQRIERYETLAPLTQEESLRYITYRLDNAGAKPGTVFSHEAETLLIQAANGTPRILNRLCTSALVQGGRQREKPITAKTVKAVLHEWRDPSRVAPSSRRLAYVAAAAAILMLGLLWFARAKSVPSPLTAAPSDEIEGVATPVPVLLEAPVQGVPPTAAAEEVLSARVEARVDHTPEAAGFPLTVFVGAGEDLSSIALEIYGFVDDALLAAIRQHNPHLPALGTIKTGDKLVLPSYPTPLQPSDRR